MTRVHVYGASGYAAAEAIRLLAQHPFVQLGVLESASHSGEPLAAHFPLIRGIDRTFDSPGALTASLRADDCVILGGSHGVAREIAPALLAAGARVIDLSADFRVHPSTAVYGLPERYRAAIAGAALVANPGCYPTATLLATLPLAAMHGCVQIIVDAKSGITGAGRTPSVGSLFAEVTGDVRAYGLAGHRHEPEIVQEWHAAGLDAPLTFTPHVVPIARGMLVDVYAIFAQAPDPDAVNTAFHRAYDANPFVRVLFPDRAPSLPSVVGTNDAELHVTVRGNVVRALCAIDNLGKGAAGQAVQNLNIMYGYPEETALNARAIAC
ncbi:MAG: N-acetyl-gamma-glutamyl-phosphate reductase [Vulcanimicrobiaceae bacterium]